MDGKRLALAALIAIYGTINGLSLTLTNDAAMSGDERRFGDLDTVDDIAAVLQHATRLWT
jgi:hypothetical protein